MSVVPYTLWHNDKLDWKSLGDQVTDMQGRKLPGALQWFGVPCEIGELEVNLADQKVVAGPYRIVAKFPRAAHPNALVENMPILGMNFLSDNHLRFVLDGRGTVLVANLNW